MLFVSAEYVLKATLSYKLPLNLDLNINFDSDLDNSTA